MARPPKSAEFAVDLPVFQGPFDLLLQLIARRELDVTDVALAQVTDEFIEFIDRTPDLSAATEFLVVAATLLEMKAASLLPRTAEETELVDEDLSARDLLFSRLLQYKAFKEMGIRIGQRMDSESAAIARAVPLEPHFAELLPELNWNLTPAALAAIAAAALTEPPNPELAEHVARPRVSVEEQVSYLEGRLRAEKRLRFTELIQGNRDLGIVIGRFLALLEMFRRGVVNFEQSGPLEPLTVIAKED